MWSWQEKDGRETGLDLRWFLSINSTLSIGDSVAEGNCRLLFLAIKSKVLASYNGGEIYVSY